MLTRNPKCQPHGGASVCAKPSAIHRGVVETFLTARWTSSPDMPLALPAEAAILAGFAPSEGSKQNRFSAHQETGNRLGSAQRLRSVSGLVHTKHLFQYVLAFRSLFLKTPAKVDIYKNSLRLHVNRETVVRQSFSMRGNHPRSRLGTVLKPAPTCPCTG